MTFGPAPGDMTAWPEIACQRGCAVHVSRPVLVDLAVPHRYHDYPAVPARLACSWPMRVWDTAQHPVDGLEYCPARDAVSETILGTGIWEPRETILLLDVLRPDDVFVDLGCQIGWFSLAAATAGASVIAVDAEVENLRLLETSARGLGAHIETRRERIGPTSTWAPAKQQYRLVKIDLEGAEAEALARFWPLFEHGLVDHLLIEVSPTFKPGDHYPDLVDQLVGAGFEAYLLPPKRLPPYEYVDAESYLTPWRIDTRADLRELIAGCGQEDLWCRRVGAEW